MLLVTNPNKKSHVRQYVFVEKHEVRRGTRSLHASTVTDLLDICVFTGLWNGRKYPSPADSNGSGVTQEFRFVSG